MDPLALAAPLKSFVDHLGVCRPQVENHCHRDYDTGISGISLYLFVDLFGCRILLVTNCVWRITNNLQCGSFCTFNSTNYIKDSEMGNCQNLCGKPRL